MTSLLDVAPATKTVNVQGTKVEVRGVSVYGISLLMSRFPELRDLLSGKDVEVTADILMDGVPEAVKAVIAAGVGEPGNEQFEAKAESLPVGDQFDLIQAIIALTVPEGVGPFVRKVRALLSQSGVSDAGGKAVDTKSQPQSSS